MNAQELQTAITNRIIGLMEAGVKSGGKLWTNTVKSWGANGLPFNAATGREYSGINTVVLWMAKEANGYSSNAWATFKQIQAKGWKLRKGSKGEAIIFWNILEREDKDTGDIKKIPMMRGYYVFNADCIEGAILPEQPVLTVEDKYTYIDNIIAAHNICIHYKGNEAFYSPGADTITLPAKDAFITENNFYHTALHEMAHWTGHSSRLDRIKYGARFGSAAYAFEELTAELSSAFSMGMLGLGESEMEFHASYLKSWIKVLKNDKGFIFKAASKAQSATNYLLAKVQETELDEAA